jgi:hypothetical protein
MTAGVLEGHLRLAKELLMLQLLVAEPEQRAEMCPVAPPVLLHETVQVQGDELLVVAEQVHVAEGPAVVQRALLALVEEVEADRAHPGGGHDRPGCVERAVAEDLAHRPRHVLRGRYDRCVVEPSSERVPGRCHDRPFVG